MIDLNEEYNSALNIKIITQLIIKMADNKKREDRVADIYSTLREVCFSIGNRMREIRLKERRDKCLKKN